MNNNYQRHLRFFRSSSVKCCDCGHEAKDNLSTLGHRSKAAAAALRTIAQRRGTPHRARRPARVSADAGRGGIASRPRTGRARDRPCPEGRERRRPPRACRNHCIVGQRTERSMSAALMASDLSGVELRKSTHAHRVTPSSC